MGFPQTSYYKKPSWHNSSLIGLQKWEIYYCVLGNGHRIKITLPNSMILASFSSIENAVPNGVEKLHHISLKIKYRISSGPPFLGRPVYFPQCSSELSSIFKSKIEKYFHRELNPGHWLKTLDHRGETAARRDRIPLTYWQIASLRSGPPVWSSDLRIGVLIQWPRFDSRQRHFFKLWFKEA